MKDTALLIIDVQNSMIVDNPYNGKLLISNIQKLLQLAKDHSLPVIYIRHDGGKGDSLEKGTPGWEIYEEIAPPKNSPIFDKRFNSAFKETGLHDYLQSVNIQKLILSGLQTEYCIDATCKSAFDLGYEIIIPENSTTTYDNAFFPADKLTKFFETKIWSGRFASVIPMEHMPTEFSQ